MATYSFQVNPRLSLNLPPVPPGSTPISSVPGISPVIRPPPPSATGHLMAMHSLIGSSRPILITPQGFPVTTNPQIFGDMFATRTIAAPVLSSGFNDSPLDFNVLQPKPFEDEGKLQAQNEKLLKNEERHSLNLKADSHERSNPLERQNSEESNAERNTPMDSDSDDCQIITEIRSCAERTNTSQLSSVNCITNQNVSLMASNSGVWNNLVSNVNFPMLGVNQMLTSNIINPSLYVGQTFGVFNNALTQLPNNGNTSEQDSNAPVKSIIHHNSCTLFPPNANAPAPTTRDRPQGCKTVFVGGLPENVKEEVVREVFAFCGDIANIRLSNKKFCHIRFSEESAVDHALTLSGYRMRLGSSLDTSNTGRLHVDFAHARDDQYEWECKQRQFQREQRHKERLLQENCREASPSGPSYYTESEANGVLEKLKGEDTFMNAISVAVCWLDRGECNKRNVNTFYIMIQSINSHIRRLLNEKSVCETEYKRAKDILKSRAQSILIQFAQIEKFFVSSSHKKVWDHFTKAQRKNIEIWKKSAMEIKKLPAEAHESMSDDMNVSDSDSDDVSLYKKRKLDVHETNSLKDENDSLRCQLEAYKNEICVVRSELQCDMNRKDEQISLLQKTLNTLSQEVDRVKKQPVPQQETSEAGDKNAQEADTTVIPIVFNHNSLVEKEAKLIGLISIFLHIHPFGAGVEYIHSFLQKTVPMLRITEIEHIMSRFPSVFQQEVVGIGANMERRWKYAGFYTDSDSNKVHT